MAPGATPAIDKPLLSVDGLSVRIGGTPVLQGIRLTVAAGEILGLIGPNGAGKTTLVNCLTGVHRLARGSARLGSLELLGMRPHEIASAGVGRTFQTPALFGSMTVRDNVRVGAAAPERHRGSSRRGARRRIDGRADAAINSLGLGNAAGRRVSDLPFGMRRLVDLARALAGEPSLLLLDEPASGLSREEARIFVSQLKTACTSLGCGVLLIEHNVPLVVEASSRVIVLDLGRVIAEEPAASVQGSPTVIRAYLGTAAT